MIWLLVRRLFPPRDRYLRQAMEDQRRTDYPGCRAGIMRCRAMCGCKSESVPNWSFVRVRAALLRARDTGVDVQRPYEPLSEFISDQHRRNI